MSFSKILHKRSLSAGSVPAAGAIDVGEIVLNAADGKLFTKTTTDVVKHFTSDSEQPYTLNQSLSSIYPTRGNNVVTGVFSTIHNGISCSVTGAGTTIANGELNINHADYSFIGSGTDNVAGSAADFGGIFAGQNNSLQHQNSFIIGSNITTHAENFTYVENLSVIGNLYVAGSSVNGGGGGGGSSDWGSITNKPTTLSGYGIVDAAPLTLNTFVETNSASWNNAYTNVNTNSAKWENVYTNVNSNSANWNGVRTTVNSNSAKWENVYTNVNSNSADWSGARTTVNSNSAKWENVYTNVNSNSANWNSVRTTVNSNSAKWENVYTNVNTNSGTYATKSYVHNNFLPLTGGLVTNTLSSEHLVALSSFAAIGFGSIEDTPTFYVGVSVVGINTEYPNAALTVVGDISATGSLYSTEALSWNGVYTNVNTNSAKWENVYTNVNSNSANWNGVRTTVNSNSAKWENVYTNVNSNSANWNSTRTTVNSNSAKWENVYTNVNSNSADWNSTKTTVNSNSAKWENVYTNVNSNSANWNSVYTSYSGASGTYVTNSYLQTNFVSITGGNITGNITAVKFYGDGSELTGIVAGDTEATTLVRSNSSNWDSVYTSYNQASGSYIDKNYIHTNFLPLTGGVIVGALTGTDILATGTVEISSNNPTRALTVVGNVSSTGTLYGNNIEVGIAAGAVTVYVGPSSVGINTETPSTTLDVSGSNIRITDTKTPANSGADGVQGEICWDSDYLYVCVATNTWKRAALQSW